MQGRTPINCIVFDEAVRRQLLEPRTSARPLLPNLRTIVSWTNDLPLISLFLTPSVHYLKVVMHPAQATALSSLALDIPLRAPKLRSLYLAESAVWNVSHKAQFIDALGDLLNHLQLEEFVCHWFPLSDKMLSAVLGMPELSSVGIYTTMPALAQIMYTRPVQEARIREFSLSTPLLIPSHLPHIISSLLPSKLEALRITARRGSWKQEELKDLISSLANTCSAEHLTDIYIDSGRYDPSEAAAVIDFKTLKPLLQFVHLRHLSLSAHPFELTDAEVKVMAMAWPNLEDLYYWQYQYTSPGGLTNTVPTTSPRGLLWLATHCRKLRALTFTFRASINDAEYFTDDEVALGAGHNLNFLDVGFSEIESAEEVARFISRVFPNLTLLVFRNGGAESEPNTERWEEVQALIRLA